jgi:hypothetical protein
MEQENKIESVFSFTKVGHFLFLTEEEFERMIPEFINWHRQVRKYCIEEDLDEQDVSDIVMKWVDDGKVGDVIVENKFSENYTERFWLSGGSEK